MSLRYLLDENVHPLYKIQLRRKQPELMVWQVGGEPTTPPKGTLDPEILLWCEEHGFVLVTNNRASMPGHLRDHIGCISMQVKTQKLNAFRQEARGNRQ